MTPEYAVARGAAQHLKFALLTHGLADVGVHVQVNDTRVVLPGRELTRDDWVAIHSWAGQALSQAGHHILDALGHDTEIDVSFGALPPSDYTTTAPR